MTITIRRPSAVLIGAALTGALATTVVLAPADAQRVAGYSHTNADGQDLPLPLPLPLPPA